MPPSCTKPESPVTADAVVFVVANDPDSSFSHRGIITNYVEPFPVAVCRPRGRCTSQQRIPRVFTQWGGAVLPVMLSDHWVQRAGLPPDRNEVDILVDLHTETDLGEGCSPVARQLGLLWIKPSLPSSRVVVICIAPVSWVKMKSVLRKNRKNDQLQNYPWDMSTEHNLFFSFKYTSTLPYAVVMISSQCISILVPRAPRFFFEPEPTWLNNVCACAGCHDSNSKFWARTCWCVVLKHDGKER